MSEAVPAVERWLAWRYLATRQKEGFVSFIAMFSLIGVALGVATLIVVLSGMGGFRQQIIDRILGLNGHVVIAARSGVLQATPELLARLEAFPGVTAAHLTLERQSLVTVGQNTRGAVVRGVAPDDLRARSIIAGNMVMGDLASFGAQPGAVMGERLRQSLNARPGDRITLVTHRLNDNGTIAPRYTDYDVLGSFVTRRWEFDNSLIFVPLALLRDDLELGDQAVTSIDLDVRDPQAAPRIAQELRQALGRDDLRVSDWLGLNARFVGALQVERVMMFIILTLIVVVAAMNVVASFTMLVRVKRGSIAILRTMGATRGSIMRIFSITGTTIGFAGTIVGLVLGLLIAVNAEAIRKWLSDVIGIRIFPPEVFFLSELPTRINPGEVTAVVVLSLALSFLATLYPSWRAAQYDPVEALRYE